MRSPAAKARRLRGHLYAVDERGPGGRVVGEQQVSVEVDVVESGATAQPAAMPRPDSIMQPSITPRPSARAAWAIRIAFRMPPDFASLMLIPCATSRQAATSESVWQSSST